MKPWQKYCYFALIVAINIVLKSLYASHSPYSYDEIISVKDTLLDFGHIKHESEWDNNPPFYYYCLWVWHSIISVSEFNSRFLSVIFVSLSIGVVFLFVKKHFSLKAAVFSAVLLTLSNFLTYYAQETRTYSLVLFLSMLSSMIFFNYIENEKQPTLFILSLINFLIIYSHYIAGIILIGQYVIFFFHGKNKYRFYLVQTLIISALVYIRFTKKQFLNIVNYNHKNDFWLKPANINDLLGTLTDLFYNKYTAFFFILAFLIFSVKFFGTDERRNKKVLIYCALLGFLSILLLFGIGTFKALFLGRYLIFAIPFATILVIVCVCEMEKYSYLFLGSLIALQFLHIKLYKDIGVDYRAIAGLVKSFKETNDIVVINTRDNIGLFQYYYNRDLFLKHKKIDSLCKSQSIYGVNNIEQLNSINFKDAKNVFLVQSFHKINTNENIIGNSLNTKFNKIFFTNSVSGIEFSLYKK